MRDMFRLTPDVKVGYSYLNGYDVPYELSADGKLKIEIEINTTQTDYDCREEPPNEHERTASMLINIYVKQVR